MSILLNSRQPSTEKGNYGPWTSEETLKYVIFLEQNKTIMCSKLKKKYTKTLF